MGAYSRWNGVGRDPEKVKAKRRAYELRHPDRVKARRVARQKAIQALPWEHPIRVKIRETQLARYYREKALVEGLKPTKKRTQKYRARHRARKYGLSVEAYTELVVAQDLKCAICGQEETALSKFGKKKDLAVDHCHGTKKVRGLLCQGCNTGLGGFKDDILRLKRAIAYLKRGGSPLDDAEEPSRGLGSG